MWKVDLSLLMFLDNVAYWSLHLKVFNKGSQFNQFTLQSSVRKNTPPPPKKKKKNNNNNNNNNNKHNNNNNNNNNNKQTNKNNKINQIYEGYEWFSCWLYVKHHIFCYEKCNLVLPIYSCWRVCNLETWSEMLIYSLPILACLMVIPWD